LVVPPSIIAVQALWAERDERPFAWVSVDRSDNDPVSFVGSVITALDPILHLLPSRSPSADRAWLLMGQPDDGIGLRPGGGTPAVARRIDDE